MKLKTFSAIGLMVFAIACGSAIPKESLKQVDPEITFQMLIKDPDRYKGKVVLVGGQIVSTTVRESESWVEILQQPLDWKQRPQNTDVSYGRFLVRFQGFLDPAIYAAGKKITVLGEVLGKKSSASQRNGIYLCSATSPRALPLEPRNLWRAFNSIWHRGRGSYPIKGSIFPRRLSVISGDRPKFSKS